MKLLIIILNNNNRNKFIIDLIFKLQLNYKIKYIRKNVFLLSLIFFNYIKQILILAQKLKAKFFLDRSQKNHVSTKSMISYINNELACSIS